MGMGERQRTMTAVPVKFGFFKKNVFIEQKFLKPLALAYINMSKNYKRDALFNSNTNNLSII